MYYQIYSNINLLSYVVYTWAGFRLLLLENQFEKQFISIGFTFQKLLPLLVITQFLLKFIHRTTNYDFSGCFSE